ncbi:hypothetical protein WA026_010150 [Henosepilachna vigintioctopunctata]|uniref:Uncharacterized protein n=1 Tax=Henosepilachna vigintioctopunctata TaxID=420089 RepID=A0AAW1UIE6_9CUCU
MHKFLFYGASSFSKSGSSDDQDTGLGHQRHPNLGVELGIVNVERCYKSLNKFAYNTARKDVEGPNKMSSCYTTLGNRFD